MILSELVGSLKQHLGISIKRRSLGKLKNKEHGY